MQAVLAAHNAVLQSMRPGVCWIDMHEYIFVFNLLIFLVFVPLNEQQFTFPSTPYTGKVEAMVIW